jgi:DNA polymerase-3 subunit delta
VGTITAGGAWKDIRARTPAAIYLLMGEDEVEKSALARGFDDLVDPDIRAFNVDRIHAGDWTTGDRLAAGVGSLVAAARTLPMMSDRRIVTVFQADPLLAPKRESAAATRALQELEALLKAPEAQTTLVLVAGSVDKRSRLFKILLKEATIVECGVLEDRADAERWIATRVEAAGAAIAPAGAKLLAERCGTDVVRLRNDVERLLLYALGQDRITLDDVKAIAGPAGLQDDWAMTNAIESANAAEALRQLALMLDAGAPPEKILGQLGWLVRSRFVALAPAALSLAIEQVLRTDLDLKRSAGDPRILLERLIVELCGNRRPMRSGARY